MTTAETPPPAAPAPEKFDQWAIVEIFGHQRIAGRVCEELLAGKAFLRVDVPAVGEGQPFTRYYGAAAVYSLTPTTEEIARLAATQLQVDPIQIYIPIPSTRQLAAGRGRPRGDQRADGVQAIGTCNSSPPAGSSNQNGMAFVPRENSSMSPPHGVGGPPHERR